MSSHTSKNQWEHPTDGQLIHFFRAIEEQQVGKDDLQRFLDYLYLRSTDQRPDEQKVFGPQISELMQLILWGAQKYFPGAVSEIVALLMPYAQLKSVSFKFARTVKGLVPNPDYEAQMLLWQKEHKQFETAAGRPLAQDLKYNNLWAVKKAQNEIRIGGGGPMSGCHLDDFEAAQYAEHTLNRPQSHIPGLVFERAEELVEALSFLFEGPVPPLDIKIHTLGKDWKPMDDASPDKNILWDLVNDRMYPEQISARMKHDPECLSNASSAVVSQLRREVVKLMRAEGAYRYHLVSLQDIEHLAHSISNALSRAVVLTAIQPAPKLVAKVLQFVNFQLSGTPIIAYKDGVVHLLSAPYNSLAEELNGL